jgi:hypothetical protein
MQVGFNNKAFNLSKVNAVNQISFKGEFEDIMQLAKTNNSPNTIDLTKTKFFGPKRYIHPTAERLQIIETAVSSPETKGAWKGFFRSLADAWRKVL